ncbi:MAG: SCO family protein [Casimicrobium sp.]
MWRTASLTVLAALLAYAASAWLTMDFNVWTAEGARRLHVARAKVPAPSVALRGPGIDATLPALLKRDGQVTIIDFVYTRCTTVCLALGSTFQQMQSTLAALPRLDRAAAPRVQLLSISFDPEHDTTAVLAAYAKGLNADPARWRFAAPVDSDGLTKLLASFEVVVIPDGMGGFEHNAALLVVDAHGHLVRIFDYAEMEAALAYAQYLSTQSAPASQKAAG